MGVTVQIMGSTSGTVTGADGDFSLAAPADGIIQFSYIGFTSVERPVKVDKKAIATLHLLPDDLGMVERIDGTWNMSGETFTIEGDLIPGMTAKLSFDIKQMSESVMECQMKVDLPLLPPNGIPVVFKKK